MQKEFVESVSPATTITAQAGEGLGEYAPFVEFGLLGVVVLGIGKYFIDTTAKRQDEVAKTSQQMIRTIQDTIQNSSDRFDKVTESFTEAQIKSTEQLLEIQKAAIEAIQKNSETLSRQERVLEQTTVAQQQQQENLQKLNTAIFQALERGEDIQGRVVDGVEKLLELAEAFINGDVKLRRGGRWWEKGR